MKVVISSDLDFSEAGTVWANIAIEHHGEFFPSQHWSDFVLRIFDNWGENIISLLSGKSGYIKFWFYDGAVSLRCKRNNGSLSVRLARDLIAPDPNVYNIIKEFSCEFQEFYISYVGCAEEIINKLDNVALSERTQSAEGLSIINIKSHIRNIRSLASYEH
jgi:hypothetical protein